MGDKCQNQQQMPNPWQYPQQYGMYNAYPGQTYGQGGYPHQGYFYYQDMGYGMNIHNQMQHLPVNNGMMPKQYSPGFGQTGGSNMGQMSEQRKDDKGNDLPPLPPGPAPPTSIANYPTSPPPPGTVPIEDHTLFFNQPPNCNYGPIKFNLPGKKTGLGFNSFNNSGGGKKRRKRNKNNQFSNISFSSGSPGAMYPHPPPLPAEAPPLPPLPQEPLPPPPPEDGSEEVCERLANLGEGQDAASQPELPPAQQPAPVPAAVAAPTQPNNDWPESLQNYVARCYAKCVETVDKDQVEIILKGKITRAANDGSLWIKNWDQEPLPSLHSERKFIEIKKKEAPALAPPRHQQGATQGPRKGGLSSTLSSRLGARNSGGGGRGRRSRSRSRSRSPAFRRRNRSRSSDGSRSPVRHRKAKSSSSSDENYKPLRVTKSRDGIRVTDRLTLKPRNKQKGKNKQNKGHPTTTTEHHNKQDTWKLTESLKSHIYTEFGLGSEMQTSSELLQKRAARFSASLKAPTPSPKRKKPLNLASSLSNSLVDESVGDIDWSEYHIVGTCQDVEKTYLRLTAAPDASIVRPRDILRSALKNVKERWNKNKDYRYICDQMKSIRQDLTVQGIRDDFTVEVYEAHARIALENGDHEEFNQCQTQLRMLYMEIGGLNEKEFLAYRILYYIFTKNTQDLTSILATLKPDDKQDECVKFALDLRAAWWLGNYHRFFKLYFTAPRMSSYLVDWFIERERKAALKAMIKSFRQVLPITFVARELGFALEEGVSWEENVHKFLAPFGLTFSDAAKHSIDCRQSVGVLANF
ncbi:leukocyte receptor cluster member 8 isoform X2 [Bacillus rossius redtenbacheri]|uniref:leukocyte receptor cluster member 8 isoform X2 n=1 Tax=Bacillus rossius redtenbacheri TaxID=93214 RepID=UPI002FDE8A40